MKEKHPVAAQVLLLLVGEIIVSLLIAGVYLAIGKLDYTVPLGAAVGTLVTVANFAVLALSVDRLTKEILELRGTDEMSEEEQEKFIADNRASVNVRVKSSYLIRSVATVVLLVVALLTKVFDPIATLIPLLLYRPILILVNLIFKDKTVG